MRKEEQKPFSTVTEAVDDLLNKIDAHEARKEDEAARQKKLHEDNEARARENTKKIDASIELAKGIFSTMVAQYKERGRTAEIKTNTDARIIANDSHRKYRLGVAIQFQYARDAVRTAEIGFWRILDHEGKHSNALCVFASTDATKEENRSLIEDILSPANLTEARIDESIRKAIQWLGTQRR